MTQTVYFCRSIDFVQDNVCTCEKDFCNTYNVSSTVSPGLMRQRDIEKEHTGVTKFVWVWSWSILMDASFLPKSDPCLPLSVPNSLTQFCLVDLIDVPLIGENGNSMRAEGLTRASSNALMAEVWSRFWG